jgi:Putative zinc-finger
VKSEFTCAQCRDALPGYVAGTLARTERLLVEGHLAACDACLQDYAQWRTLADLAHQADAQTPEASAQNVTGTWAAIQARILAESPVSIGVRSVNDSEHDSSPSSGTARAVSPPPARPALRHRHVPMGATATAAALLLVALAVGLFAYHPRGGSATVVHGVRTPTPLPTQTPDLGIMDVFYWGSDALSPTDAWAVGYGHENRDYSITMGVISHFDGKQWQVDKNATFEDSTLFGISMDSATDGWAVGSHTVDRQSGAVVPFLAHYTQGQWVTQTLNLPNISLRQVQMFGPDAGWATGGDNNGPVFLHFQHGVWTPTMFAPTLAALTQAASTHAASPLAYYAPQSPRAGRPKVAVAQAQFLSDTEGWATGIDQTGVAVWQFHNGQWQTVLHFVTEPGAAFLGLGVNSNTDVWVLGTAGVGTAFSSAKLTFHPLSTLSSGPLVLLHFDGHAWVRVPVDTAANVPFLDGATWMANYGAVDQQQMITGLLVNQSGHWSGTTFPQPVNSVLNAHKAPDGSTLVVAVTDEFTKTLHLLRYANGQWSNV